MVERLHVRVWALGTASSSLRTATDGRHSALPASAVTSPGSTRLYYQPAEQPRQKRRRRRSRTSVLFCCWVDLVAAPPRQINANAFV